MSKDRAKKLRCQGDRSPGTPVRQPSLPAASGEVERADRSAQDLALTHCLTPQRQQPQHTSSLPQPACVPRVSPGWWAAYLCRADTGIDGPIC